MPPSASSAEIKACMLHEYSKLALRKRGDGMVFHQLLPTVDAVLDSDNDRSSTPNSTPDSTSTHEFSHESFDTFQEKILSLVGSLGNIKALSVKRVNGGSYNRIIIAGFAFSHASAPEELKGVFRIPRFPQDDSTRPDSKIQDQAAVLELLTSHDLPTPRLLAFDSTRDNSIQLPYVLQEFGTGVPLSTVYDEMSPCEKKSIVKELVGFLLKMEAITFTSAGVLRHTTQLSSSSDQRFPETFISWQSMEPSLLKDSVAVSGLEIGFGARRFYQKPSKTLHDMLYKQMTAWSDFEESNSRLDRADDPVLQMWLRLLVIQEEMAGLGFFLPRNDCTENILFHWDLKPRNILVRKKDEGLDGQNSEWEIDKIIDWDSIYSMPPIITRTPPVWLWAFSDTCGGSASSPNPEDYYDDDVDSIPLDRYDVTSGGGGFDPVSEEIKELFEQCFVQGLMVRYPTMNEAIYHDEAYGTGRWIRRLARFAIHGASDAQDLHRFRRLDHEWSAFYARARVPDVEKEAQASTLCG